MDVLLLCLLSYLIGNISGGLIVGKLIYGVDIREHGSGNAGMTNAARTLGKKAGAATFIVDFIKGIVAATIGAYFLGEANASFGIMLSGIFVVLGHDWPILYRFKGGKGIATSFGVLMVAQPILALVVFAIFLTITVVSKYVSLGSVLAAIIGLAYGGYLFLSGTEYLYLSAMILVLGLLTLFKHRTNIVRLILGEENKIG